MFLSCKYGESHTTSTETFSYVTHLNYLLSTADLTTIGGKIRYYRESKGLLLEDLSKLSNIHLYNLQKLETNKSIPTLETCDKLAKALNIPNHLIYNEYMIFITSDYPSQIKNLRSKLKLTQAQFAKQIGTERKRVSYWERGLQSPSPKYYEVLKSLLQ